MNTQDAHTVLRCLIKCDNFFAECQACKDQTGGKELKTNYFDLDDIRPTGICSRCLTGRRSGHRCIQVRECSEPHAG